MKKKGGYQVQDKWFQKAKAEGYRARSAYKLLEIQEKFRLVRPGANILDVASAPGSWLQVLGKLTKNQGIVIGFDLQEITPLSQENVHVFQGDIFEKEEVSQKIEEISGEKTSFDLITSDIAPKTTGHTSVDQYASIELNLAILELAKDFLKPGGNLVLKVFIGEDIEDLIGPVKRNFNKLRRFKPVACRGRSFEEYFICLGKKGQ